MRSGTIDSAVSTTVVRTNIDRGCAARRARRAMRRPSADAMSVSGAKPSSGIASPGADSNETPAAEAPAATSVVATAATPPAPSAAFHSGRTQLSCDDVDVVVAVVVVVVVVGTVL